jgi:hypothetical protein
MEIIECVGAGGRKAKFNVFSCKYSMGPVVYHQEITFIICHWTQRSLPKLYSELWFYVLLVHLSLWAEENHRKFSAVSVREIKLY